MKGDMSSFAHFPPATPRVMKKASSFREMSFRGAMNHASGCFRHKQRAECGDGKCSNSFESFPEVAVADGKTIGKRDSKRARKCEELAATEWGIFSSCEECPDSKKTYSVEVEASADRCQADTPPGPEFPRLQKYYYIFERKPLKIKFVSEEKNAAKPIFVDLKLPSFKCRPPRCREVLYCKYFQCSNLGFFADRRNCTKYFFCDLNSKGFALYHMECPMGRVFDPRIRECRLRETLEYRFKDRYCRGIFGTALRRSKSAKAGENWKSSESENDNIKYGKSVPHLVREKETTDRGSSAKSMNYVRSRNWATSKARNKKANFCGRRTIDADSQIEKPVLYSDAATAEAKRRLGGIRRKRRREDDYINLNTVRGARKKKRKKVNAVSSNSGNSLSPCKFGMDLSNPIAGDAFTRLYGDCPTVLIPIPTLKPMVNGNCLMTTRTTKRYTMKSTKPKSTTSVTATTLSTRTTMQATTKPTTVTTTKPKTKPTTKATTKQLQACTPFKFAGTGGYYGIGLRPNVDKTREKRLHSVENENQGVLRGESFDSGIGNSKNNLSGIIKRKCYGQRSKTMKPQISSEEETPSEYDGLSESEISSSGAPLRSSAQNKFGLHNKAEKKKRTDPKSSKSIGEENAPQMTIAENAGEPENRKVQNMEGYPCNEYGRYPDKCDIKSYYECNFHPDGNMKIEHKRCSEDEEFSPEFLECVTIEYLKLTQRRKRFPDGRHTKPTSEPEYEEYKDSPNEWLELPHGTKIPNEFRMKPKNRLRVFHLQDENSNPEKAKCHSSGDHNCDVKEHRKRTRSFTVRLNKKNDNEIKDLNEYDDEDDDYEEGDEEYEDGADYRGDKHSDSPGTTENITNSFVSAASGEKKQKFNGQLTTNKILLDADIRFDKTLGSALKNILDKREGNGITEAEVAAKYDDSNKDLILIKLSSNKNGERRKRNFVGDMFSRKSKSRSEILDKEGVIRLSTLISGMLSEYERDVILQKLERRRMMNERLQRIREGIEDRQKRKMHAERKRENNEKRNFQRPRNFLRYGRYMDKKQ